MSKSLRFCFRIDKSVGMAKDEEGNKAEAFVQAQTKGVNSYEIPREKYKKLQNGFRKMVAEQIGCDISLLTPITLNEYLDNTEEDESEVK